MTGLLGEILEGEPLTDRETEILAGAAEGETAAQTGARLFLSSETVKGYRKRVIAKLGARNGTHAVALALRRGLLPLGRSHSSSGSQLVEGCAHGDAHAAVRVAEPLVEGAHRVVALLRPRDDLAQCRCRPPTRARPA